MVRSGGGLMGVRGLYRASAKMANLTVKARRAACVVHQRGRLLVDACLLHCNAEGLDHLFAPLVTLAHSRSGLPSGALPPPSCLEPASPPLAAFSPPAHAAQPLPGEALWGMPHDDAQAGALIVLGSKIKVSSPSPAPVGLLWGPFLCKHVSSMWPCRIPLPSESWCLPRPSYPGYPCMCAMWGVCMSLWLVKKWE